MTIEELKKKDIAVNHSEEMELNRYRCPFVAVYDHPLDYTDKIVARVFDLDKPTNIVMLKDSIDEIESEMTKTHLVKFMRGEADDPKLICCWG